MSVTATQKSRWDSTSAAFLYSGLPQARNQERTFDEAYFYQSGGPRQASGFGATAARLTRACCV